MIDPDLCIACGQGAQLRDLGGEDVGDDGALCLRCALERRSKLPDDRPQTPESA